MGNFTGMIWAISIRGWCWTKTHWQTWGISRMSCLSNQHRGDDGITEMSVQPGKSPWATALLNGVPWQSHRFWGVVHPRGPEPGVPKLPRSRIASKPPVIINQLLFNDFSAIVISILVTAGHGIDIYPPVIKHSDWKSPIDMMFPIITSLFRA